MNSIGSFANFVARMERGDFDSRSNQNHRFDGGRIGDTLQDRPDETYVVGRRYIGRINGVEDFGAFAWIGEGVSALIHRDNIIHALERNIPSEIFFKGQRVDVTLVKVDEAAGKFSLAYDSSYLHEKNLKCAVGTGVLVDGDSFLDVLKQHFTGFICKLMEGLERHGINAKLCLPRDVKPRIEKVCDAQGLRFLEFLKKEKKDSFIVPGAGVDYAGFLLSKAESEGWHVASRRTFAELLGNHAWIGRCAGGERRVHPCVWNPRVIQIPTLGLKLEDM